MFRKQWALLIVLSLAGLAWADDPWKAKDYREWDEKEVKRILNDSPWSRTIHVSATWRTGGGGGSGEPNLGGSADRLSGSGGGGGAPATGVGGPASNEGREPQIPRASFQIRWVSSQTIRQAMARNAVLSGRAEEGAAEEFAEQRPEEYVVAIVGEDMRPFARAQAEALKGSTYLNVKGSRQKLVPSKVEIRKSSDGKRINAAVFFFNRTTASGEPVISSAEKDLEFTCEVNRVLFKTNFNPQKMAGKQGQDL